MHFGKFAAKYINTRYYVDVHPPLAKLLITLASVFGGFDGKFDFKEIGKWVILFVTDCSVLTYASGCMKMFPT